MSDCMILRRGAENSDFIVCCPDANRHTIRLSTWNESNATMNYSENSITPKKTSNSSGGAGFCTFWPVDLTGYKKLVIDIELTDIRNTTTENYIPSFGVATAKQESLSSAFASKKMLIAGGETSLSRCVQTLDVSALTGEPYLCYKGIATGTIYDFRLK